ncbi:MAG TPA: RsmD family RNA methyltransferase, partial [Gammaproteobacteria bacterium]
AEGGELVQADAFTWLSLEPKPFELVFLDPPFDADLVPAACARLAQGWLKPGAWVYVEHAAEQPPVLPAGWQVLKESRAGRVAFRLVTAPV